MTVSNREIAEVLESIARLLEVEDASPFRIRAHRNAADTVRSHGRALTEMVAAGENLTDVQDIGPGIAKKIEELLAIGKRAFLEQLETRAGPGILDLLRVPGLGPKRVRAVREALGITSIEELRAAAEEGRVRGIPGFGEKTEASILRRLRRMAGE